MLSSIVQHSIVQQLHAPGSPFISEERHFLWTPGSLVPHLKITYSKHWYVHSCGRNPDNLIALAPANVVPRTERLGALGQRGRVHVLVLAAVARFCGLIHRAATADAEWLLLLLLSRSVHGLHWAAHEGMYKTDADFLDYKLKQKVVCLDRSNLLLAKYICSNFRDGC